MKLHTESQGSPAWLALRTQFFTASEAPAMMGVSPYATRNELLHQKHTGLTQEVDAGKQRLFNQGHQTESGFLPHAEALVGDELYPVVGSVELDGLKLLASFDGLNLDYTIGYEHKLASDSNVRAIKETGEPPIHHVWQLEHQILVSGAEKILFVTSDGTAEGATFCWYVSKPERRAALIAGWRQFAADLAVYVPSIATVSPVAKPVAHLPVVFDLRVEGKLVACNLEQYKPAALAYIAAINTKLESDQDFADATADAKFCRESAAKLKLAIEQALGQMGDVNAAISTVREIAAAFDAKGLALEKQVKSETDARREAIVTGGASALRAHIASLNQRIGKPLMPAIPADFAGAIKGKRNLDSMQNAVDTELARAKIAANEVADRIQLNLQAIADSGLVVHDTASLVLKAPDDLAAVIAQRQAVEREREEKARAAIRAEEEAKAQREAAQKLAAEQAAARVISQAAAPSLGDVLETVAPAPIAAALTGRASIQTAPVAARPAPVAADTGERINLGQINAAIAPLSITAAGLSELGFEHVGTERASKLYAASQLHLMRTAMAKHLLRTNTLEEA